MNLIRQLLRALFPSRRRRRSSRPSEESQVIPFRPANDPVAHTPVAPIRLPAAQDQHEVIKGHCYVIDGDTIVINKVNVRLAGIDAPELDQPYGKAAKGTLIRLCSGRVVTAITDGSFSHDRTVAVCMLDDGRDLSAEMVKAGLALDWGKYSTGKYRSLEEPGLRRKLWRVDARQKGKMPPKQRWE